MRSVLAIFASTVLGVFLNIGALAACPFLFDTSTAAHDCCPRTASPTRCPLAPTVETCPFYVTEAKIGIAQSPITFAIGPVIRIEPAALDATWFPAAESEFSPPIADDIYLRNRVLRI